MLAAPRLLSAQGSTYVLGPPRVLWASSRGHILGIWGGLWSAVLSWPGLLSLLELVPAETIHPWNESDSVGSEFLPRHMLLPAFKDESVWWVPSPPMCASGAGVLCWPLLAMCCW